tara:strand:+ start:506 stop:1504 length:999 start_codon:yes stop_codon:yes gene_type:complete
MSNVVQSFVERISESWRESVLKIIETSQILVESENTLSELEFMDMVTLLPMSQSTVSKLLMIGKNDYLSNKVENLPPYWTTLYQISTLSSDQIDKGIEEGYIHPSSSKREIDFFINKFIEGTLNDDEKNDDELKITSEPILGSFIVPKEFDVKELDNIQKDIKKLEKKYGIKFKSDTSKKGLLGLRRKLLSMEIDGWLENRKNEYNKTKLGFDDIQIIEDTFSQLRGEITYHQNSDGTYSENDIRNPKHPYNGWSSGNLYHFCRENMIVCRYTQLREIDKIGYIKSLIKTHCDGDSKKRSDVKKKLIRFSKRGNEESKRESVIGLDTIIESK